MRPALALVQGPADGSVVHSQVWIMQSWCNRGPLVAAIERGELQNEDGSPNMLAILETGEAEPQPGKTYSLLRDTHAGPCDKC
jgi:hypothetical protein